MKVGITGATGFLGAHLLAKLREPWRFQLRALTRTLSRASLLKSTDIEWMHGDLNIPSDCVEFVRGLDVILHLAHENSPLTSDRHLPGDVLGSLIPTLNLVEAVRLTDGCPHVVFASSGGTIYANCGNRRPYREVDPCVPTSSYGIQKLAIELYLHLAVRNGWLTATSLRIGNAYGALLPPQRRQGFIGVAVARVINQEPISIFGDPNNVRDYVHLDDVSTAFTLAATHREHWSIYNIGSGKGSSVLDIVRTIESVLGRTVEVKYEKLSLPAERLIPWSVLDISRAELELGWTPRVCLEDGVRSMLRDLKLRTE